MSALGQRLGQAEAGRFFIVGDQDAQDHDTRILMEKQVPSGPLVQSIWPPSSSTRRPTTYSPSPVPSGLVDRNGSENRARPSSGGAGALSRHSHTVSPLRRWHRPQTH